MIYHPNRYPPVFSNRSKAQAVLYLLAQLLLIGLAFIYINTIAWYIANAIYIIFN